MTRRKKLWLLGPASLVLLVVLALIDRQLTDRGGFGIIDFELSASADDAERILAAWGEDGRTEARWSLWLDFPFMLSYGAFWFLAARAVAAGARERGRARLARAASIAAPLAVMAAVFDAAENVFLLLTLAAVKIGSEPQFATFFASVKFVALLISIGTVLFGAVSLRRSGR